MAKSKKKVVLKKKIAKKAKKIVKRKKSKTGMTEEKFNYYLQKIAEI